MNKKVFVSGCFDCLHAGHIEFLKQAAEFGDLYVSVASDVTIKRLKELTPTYNEKERLFIINNIKSVKEAYIGSGVGILDFVNELEKVKPDIFIVNKDGDAKEKKELCEKMGIEYIVLERKPHENLPERSSTELRYKKSKIPYRLDIAGAWLDQPYVSKYYSGPVLDISIEPEQFFNFRSGMASSTRNKAIKLWGDFLPKEDPEHLAKILFSFENPPGTPEREIAGAQDHIGIIFPGLTYSLFDGKYWPTKIENILDEDILDWLEKNIYLIELEKRRDDYYVFKGENITTENVKKLSDAANECFNAIIQKDFNRFAKSFTDSFDAQINMFPATCPDWIKEKIEYYRNSGVSGWKLTGAGGGGYLVLLSQTPIENAIKIKIRRK